MGDPKANRIDETLRSLFESLVPQDISIDNVQDDAVEVAIQRATEIVHNSVNEDLPSTVNQASDLIKRRLLRENSSPEKAATFSNLYSRLLSIPVLNQKWAILYLLLQISQDKTTGLPRRPLADSEQYANIGRRPQELLPKSEYGSNEIAREELSEEPHDHQETHIPSRSRPTSKRLDQATSAGQNDAEQVQYQTYSEPTPKKVIQPSELELLRDIPFNLQGISSAHLKFKSTGTLSLPKTLPIPIISLLHTLAEPCLLYKSLTEFTEAQGEELMTQSLGAAITNELRLYLTLIATLEAEIRRAMTALESETEKKSIKQAGVTLKRCVIWTRDATMGLRLMSMIVDESKTKRGGQLLSLIHGLAATHGDPFVGAFTQKLLVSVAKPFYDMLRRWIYDGELMDPYHEFFVTEPDPATKPDVDPRRVATSVWEDKYTLDDSQIPSIISSELAKKIFLIGKSLNFIRHSCGDPDWVIQYSKTHSKSLSHDNTVNLSSSIDAAYQMTMSHLTNLMSEKFHLFIHLSAIKRYLLLSQGDFIELLMESLAPNLDRPANSQYRHTLTSQLEHAIRHSNAQYDSPEVLGRLDARMLELSSGEIGWDCFTLEYKVSPPCDVIITQWANTQYLKVFNLLWRIKRVQFSLNSTYRRCMTGSRGVIAAVEDKLGSDWKKAHCVVAEMVHFVNQLQYYILFEVIESSWEVLQASIQKPNTTLDDLIEAHTKYINSITHKGLLGQQRHSSTGQREDSFLSQLHYILKCMLAYRDVVDGLYSFSVAEFTKRQQFSAKIEQRTAAGKWGITEKDFDSRSSTPLPGSTLPKSNNVEREPYLDEADSPALLSSALVDSGSMVDDSTLLTSLRTRLLQLSAEFRSRINVLLYDLAHQPDVDMRFLGVVMNFNESYKPVNVKRMQARKEREKRKVDERRMDDGGGKMEASFGDVKEEM